jgi:hypothetical protein
MQKYAAVDDEPGKSQPQRAHGGAPAAARGPKPNNVLARDSSTASTGGKKTAALAYIACDTSASHGAALFGARAITQGPVTKRVRFQFPDGDSGNNNKHRADVLVNGDAREHRRGSKGARVCTRARARQISSKIIAINRDYAAMLKFAAVDAPPPPTSLTGQAAKKTRRRVFYEAVTTRSASLQW